MGIQKGAENSLSKSLSETNEWIIRNQRKIFAFSAAAFMAWFSWWTVWGIRHERHYFKFDVTSILFGSLFLAAIYLCISLGLNMTYDLIGFANFAHAEYFIVGAYTGVLWSYYYPNETEFYHFAVVIILAFITAGLVAVLGDILVFGPLRARGTSAESLMISSIGWGIILRNAVSIYFGPDSLYFRIPQMETLNVPVFSFSSTPIKFEAKEEPFAWKSWLIGSKSGEGFLFIKSENQFYYVNYEMIFAIFLTIFLVVTLFYFLEKTKTGTALRATADNIDLAESSGIDTEKMIKLTWFIGGGLAGVAGLIFVFRNPVIPYQGFLFLLPAFAVVVLGGVGSLKGSVIASFVIAFTQTISKSYLLGLEKYLNDENKSRGLVGSYDIVIPFVILIGMILFRPRGLYGEEE